MRSGLLSMFLLSLVTTAAAPPLPFSSNGCAAVAAAVSKCPGDAQACEPAAKSLVMCGRFTIKANWAEIIALYRLRRSYDNCVNVHSRVV